MTKAPVIRDGFQGMRRRMTEIQNFPRASVGAIDGFALVAGDDRSFETAVRRDRGGQLHAGSMRTDVTKQSNSSIEQLSITGRPLFDRFAPTRRQFTLSQRLQSVSVDQHQARLMKSSHQIFSSGGVEAGLATNRSIDLRQQGGRHLDESDAAQIRRRREARQIAYDSAAQRNYDVVPLQT